MLLACSSETHLNMISWRKQKCCIFLSFCISKRDNWLVSQFVGQMCGNSNSRLKIRCIFCQAKCYFPRMNRKNGSTLSPDSIQWIGLHQTTSSSFISPLINHILSFSINQSPCITTIFSRLNQLAPIKTYSNNTGECPASMSCMNNVYAINTYICTAEFVKKTLLHINNIISLKTAP